MTALLGAVWNVRGEGYEKLSGGLFQGDLGGS